MNNIKVGAVSLGCDKNRVDLEKMLAKLENAGFMIGQNPDECDVLIINTCAFIRPSEEEAINEIIRAGKLKQAGKIKKIIVSGCLSQRRYKDLPQNLPEVDKFLYLRENDDIVQIVASLFNVKGDENYGGVRVNTVSKTSAFLKIADGCDNACSYCTIPSIRGRYKSESEDKLLSEAKELAKNGVKELVLVAQDTTRYGTDLKNGENLITLCKKLCKIKGIAFIRIHYCYPEMVTRELLDFMKSEVKMCKYLDIPLQHIDDDILKQMRRRVGEQDTRKLISMIKKDYPEFAIRTTFIVGFPGESAKQFKKLCDFIKEVKFDYAGFFPYFREEFTYSYFMKNQKSQFIKQHRLKRIKKFQNSIASEKALERIGQITTILVDEFDEKTGYFNGHTPWLSLGIDFGVKIEDNNIIKEGDIITAEIIDFDGENYFAKTGGNYELTK